MTTSAGARVRRCIRVSGIVQGVGYRPFVYALAQRLGVAGQVGNDASGVFVEAEGSPDAVAAFVRALRAEAPPLADVTSVRAEDAAVRGDREFRIVASHLDGSVRAWVTPDTATCPDCLRELADPADRRHGYAFTNCTNCGPRFTITRAVPYDRPNTTMAAFAMCPACAAEYTDPGDRRFHAQPVCCPACGPRLQLLTADGRPIAGAPVTTAARLLADGAVLAVKGLGGYHLAAAADHERAVAALRGRKHRMDKPFAVLVPDLAAAHRLCELDDAAEALLTNPRRPIVLLPRRAGAAVAEAVAPRTGELGLLLPYTPLHHLLADAFGAPLVLTSGNVSDEPIAYRDGDALQQLGQIADAFLLHGRAIHMRTDDSVARVVRGAPMLLRRSRGYVPAPVRLPVPAAHPVLGCGAELKSTFCLARGQDAFVSHHIGDLENVETLRSYVDGIAHFQRLFGFEPEVMAHDLHPEYLSTKYALERDGVTLLGIQHHHAHIASCLADNGMTGPVIGVACDGTGYGPDGVLWGGELLLADLHGCQRLGHLAEIALPGGPTAIRQPWRMAVAYLTDLFGDAPPDLALLRRHEPQWHAVAALAGAPTTMRTTSAGRLCDAVAALVGIRDAINYEGQAAIELEQLVDRDEPGSYPMRWAGGVLHGTDLFAAAVADVRRGVAPGMIAARFHHGLAGGLAQAAEDVASGSGLSTVALSGGVFQNVVLLTGVAEHLERAGVTVLLHHQVPPNDGGISLGQAAVAAATTQ